MSDAPLSRRAFLAASAVGGAAALPLTYLGAPVAAAAADSRAPQRRTHPSKHRHKQRPAPSGLPKPAPIYAAHSNPADLGVLEAASLLQAGLLSSVELTSACEARIAQRNGPVTFAGSAETINAFVRLYPELSAEQAHAADGKLAGAAKKGTRTSLLTGVPLALKDLYAVKGLGLTASSKVLAGNVATGDSTVYTRLSKAGMVLVGHTHTHEWALGLLTPQTGNPWNLAMSVGGSSGGSGAALAARMIPAATGTDTSGSLRSPPSANGVCGLKPTFGLVPTHGVLPIGYSVDCAGVMARSAGDLGLLLSAVVGPDPADPATLTQPAPPVRYPTLPTASHKPLAGRRIGVPNGIASGLPSAVAALFTRVQDELKELGATIVPFDQPDETSTQITLDAVYAFAIDAGIYHSQFYPARAADYGVAQAALVSLFVGLTDSVSSGEYMASQRRRLQYIQAWNALFVDNALDAVLKPGADVDGAERSTINAETPGSGVTGDFAWADYAGLPVLAFTIGQSKATKLPFGAQLGGAPHTEATLLQIVIDYQAHFTYHEDAPPGLA